MQAGILTSGLQYLTRNLTATNIILEQSGHHLLALWNYSNQPVITSSFLTVVAYWRELNTGDKLLNEKRATPTLERLECFERLL